MANDLVKQKKLLSFTPPAPGSPGSAGSPALPARTVTQTVMQRVTASASSMRRTGPSQWFTPLDLLQLMTGKRWTAAQAHYTDTWQVVVTDNGTERAPLSWSDAWVEVETTQTTHYPAQAAVPAVPPTAATPASYLYDLQLGWNAGAHSGMVLASDWQGAVSFDVKRANVGVVIGFAQVTSVPSTVRSGFEDIAYGLMLGDGRIRVRHAGVQKDVGALDAENTIRAEVSNKQLSWYVDGVLVFRDRFVPQDSYVLTAALYSGGDAVLNPAFSTELTAQDGQALVSLEPFKAQGQGYEPWRVQATLGRLQSYAGDYAGGQAKAVLAPLRATDAPLVRGMAAIGQLRVMASSYSQDGVGVGKLTALQARVEAAAVEGWVPTYSMGSMVIGAPRVHASGIAGQVHEYRLQLPAPKVLASEGAHAQAQLALKPLSVVIEAEVLSNLVRVMNLLTPETPVQAQSLVVIVVAERMGVAGQATLSAAVTVVDVRETMSTQNWSVFGGKVLAMALEQLGVFEWHTALVFRMDGDDAVLLDEGSTWAVNTDSNASMRYESYGFNSFMAVQGQHFGLRHNGVYALQGSTDAGRDIAWLADFGMQDFGSQALKSLQAVYAGVSAQGSLILRIEDKQGKYSYFARRIDPVQQTQRFDPGRGLKANYFRFELVGEGEVELDNIEFAVVASNRRI